MKKIQNINITEEDGSSSNETKSRFKEYLLRLKLKRKPSTTPKEEPPKKTKLTTIGGILLQPNIVNEKKPKIVKPKKIIITPPIIDFSKSNKPNKNIDKQPVVETPKKENVKTNQQVNPISKEEIINKPKEEIINKPKEKIDYLNNQIVNKIKKRLVKYLDEIEILESELYVIGTISKDEATIEELNKTKAKVNALINKINSLKEKYKLIKNYVDNELFIDDKDDFLDEDIDYLKQLATSAEIEKNKSTIKKIKEYKLLSLELDVIEAKVKDLNSIKEKKKEELNLRDDNYQKLLDTYINNRTISEQCQKMMAEQEKALASINVNDIEAITNTTTRLVGMGEVFRSGLKYIGTVMNPFKYTRNGIAQSTILAKRLVDNALNNVHMETRTKISYQATDYSYEIDRCLNELEYVSNTIDKSLEDITYLKNRYISELIKYKYRVPKIAKTYQDIIKLENLLLSNKRKTQMMINKTNNLELANKNKLIKVKKLNNQEQNK